MHDMIPFEVSIPSKINSSLGMEAEAHSRVTSENAVFVVSHGEPKSDRKDRTHVLPPPRVP